MTYRKERHSVTGLRVHLVCVLKCRDALLTAESLLVIEEAFRSVANKMDFVVEEFNGEADHVHALVEYPPKLSVSQLINALKGVSSRKYGQAGYSKPKNKTALWSPSYFAVSVGDAPVEVLKKYIQNQKAPSDSAP